VDVRAYRDEELEKLCGQRADRFVSSRAASIAHLLLLLRIWFRLLSAPRVRLRLEDDVEAEPIRAWLNRRTLGLRTALHEAVSMLEINRRASALDGSRFGTLRRMDRKAARIGITCKRVPHEDRARLLQRAIEFEQSHPDPRYRREHPKTEGLVQTGLWLAAYSVDGRPLALSVTPVSGNVALLRYLRTVDSGPEVTLARYALTAELIRVLAEVRVRYLVDNVSPIAVSSALRHFATMTGFRIVRANIHTSASSVRFALAAASRGMPVGTHI